MNIEGNTHRRTSRGGCSPPPDWIEWTIFGQYISVFRAIYFNKFNITIYFIQKQLFLVEFFVKKLASGGGGGGGEVEKIFGKNDKAG